MKIRILLFFVLLFVISGCCHRPVGKSVSRLLEKADKKKDKASDEILIKGIIDPSLFLENRVANCNQAFKYMKNVITPGYSPVSPDDPSKALHWLGAEIRGESRDFLVRQKDDGKYVTYDNVRFYISTECLAGRDIYTVMDIFLEKKYHEPVLEALQKLEKQYGYAGSISVKMANCPELLMPYNCGYIVGASYIVGMHIY